MTKLQRSIIYFLSFMAIGALMVFAFTFFLIGLVVAPIIYLSRKLFVKKQEPEQQENNNDNGNVIDVDYEVVEEDEQDPIK